MFDLESAFSRAVSQAPSRPIVSRGRVAIAQPQGVKVMRNDIYHDLDSANTTIPSKRQVKIRSGRSDRKAWNAQRNLKSVGGYTDDMQAIYATYGYDLCVVVDSRRGYHADGVTPFRF